MNLNERAAKCMGGILSGQGHLLDSSGMCVTWNWNPGDYNHATKYGYNNPNIGEHDDE